MIDETRVGGSENLKPEFTINHEGDSFRVTSPHVDLKSEADPLLFSVTLGKNPTPIEQGTIIDNVTIDNKSPKLQNILQKARALREIPERERPRKILELLKSNVGFAYDDVMAEVALDNPEIAKWVAENTGPNTSTYNKVILSEVVDYGYGACRHLSVAMLVLAKEAGMEGAYMAYSSPVAPTLEPNPKYLIRNVTRSDNGQPLFKSSAPGDFVWSSHAWVELKTSDGDWIPVDPSTQLVGDTPEGLQTFQDANYIAYSTASFQIDRLPENVWDYDLGSLWFLPAEKSRTGVIKINCRPKPKPSVVGSGDSLDSDRAIDDEQWPKPTTYKGPLDFVVYSKIPYNSLNVKVVDFKPA